MRSNPLGIATTAAIVAIAGCSSGGEGGPGSTQTTSTTTATSSETHTPAPGAIEVSPGGVTTAIGADAESTEDEYSQACQAAKAWIDQQGGDRKSQIERFLKTLQAPDAQPGPATYNTPWAQLTPARQAAVIVAVQAGADSLC
jgi:Putative lipoprotein LpqV